jgi:DNA-directed RNA polymerase subunit RPC12/RpoP
MIDEAFICSNCNKLVEPLGYTAREHCPHCLCSMHVDNNPGDRASECKGLLRPIAIEKFKDTYKIVYKCDTCKTIKKNIMAKDDNMDLIIEIMSNPS